VCPEAQVVAVVRSDAQLGDEVAPSHRAKVAWGQTVSVCPQADIAGSPCGERRLASVMHCGQKGLSQIHRRILEIILDIEQKALRAFVA
jgi:hypothetical protein